MPECLGHKLFINEGKKKTFKHVGNMFMGKRCGFFKRQRKKIKNCFSLQNQLTIPFGQMSDCPNALA